MSGGVLQALSGLELASGVVSGSAGVDAAPVRVAQPGLSVLAALESVVGDALRQPPCLVSFSGGFDSTVILAATVGVARREGLAEPVPVTWRFAAAPSATENRWQERAIADLGVDEWVRLDGTGLEFAGDVALQVLRRHGVLYPANAFLHQPLLDRARGGTLLTGVGGDDLLGRWRWRALGDARSGRRRVTARDGLRLGSARTPLVLRAAWIGVRDPKTRLPWLRPPGAWRVRASEMLERAEEPDRWDHRVRWQAARRRLALGLASLETLAADAGARVVCPFVDPDVVDALARAGGRDGFGDRLAVLDATLGQLLPPSLRKRRSKATFGEVFLAERTRRFIASWDGTGVDPEIVDVDALAREWRTSQPDLRTALLMQQAVLASRAARP